MNSIDSILTQSLSYLPRTSDLQGVSTMKPDQVWQTALGELQLQLTGATYDTWLGTASLVAYENGLFTVGVQNDRAKDWLENRLHDLIKRTIDGIVGKPTEVRFVVWRQ